MVFHYLILSNLDLRIMNKQTKANAIVRFNFFFNYCVLSDCFLLRSLWSQLSWLLKKFTFKFDVIYNILKIKCIALKCGTHQRCYKVISYAKVTGRQQWRHSAVADYRTENICWGWDEFFIGYQTCHCA